MSLLQRSPESFPSLGFDQAKLRSWGRYFKRNMMTALHYFPLLTFSSLPLIARLTQSSKDILAISGNAILTNQNGLDALEEVKEL